MECFMKLWLLHWLVHGGNETVRNMVSLKRINVGLFSLVHNGHKFPEQYLDSISPKNLDALTFSILFRWSVFKSMIPGWSAFARKQVESVRFVSLSSKIPPSLSLHPSRSRSVHFRMGISHSWKMAGHNKGSSGRRLEVSRFLDFKNQRDGIRQKYKKEVWSLMDTSSLLKDASSNGRESPEQGRNSFSGLFRPGSDFLTYWNIF